MIEFNQKAWLKQYIGIKLSYNKNQKIILKLMNNAVFGKTMEDLGKHKNIKFVAREKRRNYLVSEPKYHTTKFFTENLLVIEIRKTQTIMNKSVYLGLSILDLGKTVMYEFWYDYVKPKYGEMQIFVIWIETASLFM